MLTEAGVVYCHEDDEDRPADYIVFSYKWEHTRTGKTGTGTVCCRSIDDARTLIARWNEDHHWWYELL